MYACARALYLIGPQTCGEDERDRDEKDDKEEDGPEGGHAVGHAVYIWNQYDGAVLRGLVSLLVQYGRLMTVRMDERIPGDHRKVTE